MYGCWLVTGLYCFILQIDAGPPEQEGRGVVEQGAGGVGLHGHP